MLQRTFTDRCSLSSAVGVDPEAFAEKKQRSRATEKFRQEASLVGMRPYLLDHILIKRRATQRHVGR